MEVDWLAHFANLLFGVAYLVRGMLWLRLLSIAACLIMAVFNYYAPAQPLWVAIYWNVFFSVVNSVQIWILMRERAAVSFTDEEKEVYQTVFRSMSPVEFMKLLRIATWQTLPPETTMIRKNEEVSHISFLYNGSVAVRISEGSEIMLKDGAFLGEMAFVSGNKASGTVITLTKTRALTWPFEELRQLFLRNPELKSSFQSILSADLASKLNTSADSPAR